MINSIKQGLSIKKTDTDQDTHFRAQILRTADVHDWLRKHHTYRHEKRRHKKRQRKRRHKGVIGTFFVTAPHADGDDRCAAHRKHSCECRHGSNKQNGDVDCPQCRRANALSDKNAVYHIVEVGHKQSAECGQMFSERVWDNTDALADGLKHDMLVGIMAGKSEQHMADDIMSRCGVGAFEARRLVRTETTCVANMAELDGYKELDIDEYEFSACLDNRTSDLCRELDGKVFKRNSAQAGVNLPPMHPFCRSTTLPILPSEEELDKELAELGDEIGADVDFDEWERNLQQDEDGKWRYVAGSADTVNADKPMRFAGNGVDKSDERGIIDIIEQATGAKREEPLPIENAVAGANPYYSQSAEYRVNCQRCVQTYELRRRGYDVVAKPKPSANNTVTWGSECFIPKDQIQESWKSFTLNLSQVAVKNEIQNSPEGARYAIYVKWKGRGKGAHVFVAEKLNGSVKYLDPQTGRQDVEYYFQKGSPGNFGFFRMDDKNILADSATIQSIVEVKKT